MQKKAISILMAAMLLCAAAAPALADNSAVDTIMAAQAVKSYTEEAVTDEMINTILAAGAKSPSARNMQPWHFTVVKNADLLSQINGQVNGVAIIISGTDEQIEGVNVDFDCGLATQNMYITANALGLGANIYGSTAAKITELKGQLGIPEGYSALVSISIGYYEADAVSAATERNEISDISNIVE